MEEKYILAIDQGTSATKGILFDFQAKIKHRYNAVHKQYYPKPGWVEHDSEEIFVKTLEAIDGVLQGAKVSGEQIQVLSITNQRETVLVWDKYTGKPIYNAVVWQCQRATDICDKLIEQGYAETVREKTGLVLSPYFSAAKIKWILDNVEGARKRAEKGELLFGTIDTWLLWKMTDGQIHATDYTNACRTQLFNIFELKWDDELLEIFTIPKTMVPEVKYSDEIFGYTSAKGIFDKEIPITGVVGDSHGALFGQNCFEKGMAKTTYGTGSSIMLNIGEKPIVSKKGIVTSIAWGISGDIRYVFEGNVNCTGSTIKWLVEDLELISSSKVAGKIAASTEDSEGVYLVPAFVGLGAPYWDGDARALICGITRSTKKAHIVRAAEESIAYQIKDVIDLMIEETGIKLKELRVDGGPTRDNFLMQFQADMLNVPVVRNDMEELSALGSAYIAGTAVGIWKDLNEIKILRAEDLIFTSKMNNEKRKRLYAGWKRAVGRTLFKL